MWPRWLESSGWIKWWVRQVGPGVPGGPGGQGGQSGQGGLGGLGCQYGGQGGPGGQGGQPGWYAFRKIWFAWSKQSEYWDGQLKCKSRTVLRAGRARCWTVPYDPHIGRLGLLLDCCLLAQVIQLLFCLIILFAQTRDEEVMSWDQSDFDGNSVVVRKSFLNKFEIELNISKFSCTLGPAHFFSAGTFSISAFLVTKRSLFPQKCQ